MNLPKLTALLESIQTIITESSFSAKWKDNVFNISSSRNFHIPLTPVISEALGWNVEMTTAHFNDVDGIINLIDSQNLRRRQVSTTTDFEDRWLGVHNVGCVAFLKGTALYGSRSDIGSVPDNSGLRWLPVRYMVNEWDDKYDVELYEIFGTHSFDQPNMGKSIKGIESWVKEHLGIFKTRSNEGGITLDSSYGYNEVILDKFQIKEVILNYQYIESVRDVNKAISRLKTENIPYRYVKTTDEFHELVDSWRPKLK